MTRSLPPTDSSRRRLLWGLAAGLYFLPNLLLHRAANDAVDWMWQGLSFEAYQALALHLAKGAGLLCALVVAVLVIQSRRSGRQAAIWGGATALVLLAHHVLVVNPVEVVHYPQYALLAVLLYRALDHVTLAAALATLLGVVDEVFQYTVLYAHHPQRDQLYLDGNDMVLNALGAGLGLAAVKLVADHRRR